VREGERERERESERKERKKKLGGVGLVRIVCVGLVSHGSIQCRHSTGPSQEKARIAYTPIVLPETLQFNNSLNL